MANKINPEMFALAVAGAIHGWTKTPHKNIRVSYGAGRDFLSVETEPLKLFDESIHLADGKAREDIEKLRAAWDNDLITMRRNFGLVVERVSQWLDEYDIIFSRTQVRFIENANGEYFYCRVGWLKTE